MIEERSIRLLDALEGRTDTLLGLLQRERDARLALKQRLAEQEAAHQALTEKARELEASCLALVEERRELVEECRELDEQNRELEEHNRRLHERLNSQGEGQGTGFPRPARRSQGLSALIGRPAPAAPEPAGDVATGAADAEPTGALPVGGRLCRANGGDGEVNSGASLEEPAATPAATTTTDVGARLVGRSAEATDAAATTDAPSPQALLAEWYQRYPGAFFKGHTRPLKVGIHEALAEQEPWPEKLVRRALACYVNLPRYLKAVREGAERIGLDGKPAGQVDAKAAEHARKKLERLQAEGRGKGGAVPGQPRRAAGKGKPGRGKTAGRGAAGKGPASKAPAAQAVPGAEPPQPSRSAPATMEEKLAALVAKHRQR
ncbi:ProQ/FinO family protein [Halomonas sp. A11-A]|uniref:ProQ/FinO family protein n=1 Tax=Halomonas sp. A11-A TaxID=2183985 RepID=UPI000D8C4436|nr:ProQ/FinO family protein [Halomonas sp. A11-A]PWV78214.1 ProQ/FINO family protein [Halomonas sp. A11-A]